MTTGLILIDIQNDYFPGGNMPLVHAEQAGDNARLLLKAARKTGTPVIHVQHLSTRSNATFFLPGTKGAEIYSGVCPQPGEEIIQKNYPNSFRNTNLQQVLMKNGIDHLVVCGMMTHLCVDATVRAGVDLGYRCTLAADACATRDLVWDGRKIPAKDVHGAFLAALSGLYAEILNAKSILTIFQQTDTPQNIS